MSTRFFKAEGKSIILGNWGDYGDILQQGMASRHEGPDTKLALKRTGPYIPPISFPGIGEIVVSSDLRDALQFSGLTGFSFLPVEKVQIVELRWEEWDLQRDEPPEYPESGEPEDYILGRQHNPEIAKELGDLWEIIVTKDARILRLQRIVDSYRELKLDMRTWDGADLFGSHDIGWVLFSERACNWFTELWNEYVQFDLFPTTEGE